MTFKQTYNAENRISTVQKLASGTCAAPGNLSAHWAFAYDGDGTRVPTLYTPYVGGQPQTAVLTAYYMGGAYEVTGSAIKKYYSIAGMMVAMNDGSGLQYLLTDHLGSTVAVTNSSGTLTSQQRYLPFGGARAIPNSPIAGTDFTYTGQRKLDDGMGGIMDYKARFYSPALMRFLQPDTIIPDQFNPQSWNRFGYVLNNPIRYNDPTGHCADPITGPICIALAPAGPPGWLVDALLLTVTVGTAIIVGIAGGTYLAETQPRVDKQAIKNVNDFNQMVSDMTRGLIYLRNKCRDNPLMCAGSILAALGILASLPVKGGCDEPESLSSCPTTTPTEPSTIITPSATEDCPLRSNCGASPTSTPEIPKLPGSELDIPTLILPPTDPPVQISPPPTRTPPFPSPNILRIHIPI
ncbi:MAG: RHS repeat-associated core domain-containing protein [Chloroflexota bacterium]